MKEAAKKRWATPQLITLVRGNAEEAVLTNCKGVGLIKDPFAPGADSCANGDPCLACSAQGAS